MARIIKINRCIDCPFVDEQRVYTADSFETESELLCGKKNKRHIAYVDWKPSERNAVKIPKWCPLPETH